MFPPGCPSASEVTVSSLRALNKSEKLVFKHRYPGDIGQYPFNPHFTPAFCYSGGSGRVYGVALPRAPRHTVEYACGALRRAPCIHARLRRLATKYGEKSGLVTMQRPTPNS